MVMKIQSASSSEELARLGPQWDAAATRPEHDRAGFLGSAAASKGRVILFVAGVDGSVPAFAPATLSRNPLPLKFGYLRIPSPRVRTLVFGAYCWMGNWDLDASTEFIRELPRLMAAEGATMAQFIWTDVRHPVMERLREAHRAAHREVQLHRSMTLPDAPGDFLTVRMRSKHRSWYRRCQRTLEEQAGGAVAWRAERAPDVDAIAPLVESVARVTYQRAIGSGFVDTPAFREMLRGHAEAGRLRIYLLLAGGAPAGFWIGTVYGETFHSMCTGYRPEFRDHAVGTQVFVRMVDSLVEEGVRVLDFGLGDAEYKERFGDSEWQDATVIIYSGSLSGIASRVSVASVAAVRRAAEAVARRTGVLQKVKTAWRQRRQRALLQADASKADSAEESKPEGGAPG